MLFHRTRVKYYSQPIFVKVDLIPIIMQYTYHTRCDS